MQLADFAEEKTGELVPTIDEAFAFVPAPLPPHMLALDWGLARRLSAAENALGQLEGMASKLASPYLVLQPLLRREAILSMQKLVDASIVEEVTGRARNRIFLAREIVEVSET